MHPTLYDRKPGFLFHPILKDSLNFAKLTSFVQYLKWKIITKLLKHSDRIKGEKADNLELAIASYTAALEVRIRQA